MKMSKPVRSKKLNGPHLMETVSSFVDTSNDPGFHAQSPGFAPTDSHTTQPMTRFLLSATQSIALPQF